MNTEPLTQSLTYAGAGEADITPELGTALSGDLARYRPADAILDPLTARALVVEGPTAEGGRIRFCYISLELLSIEAEKTARIRGEIETQTGIPADNILVHTIQNHSAPGLGHYFFRRDSPYLPAESRWALGCSEDYEDLVVERILTAVTQAMGRMEPVEIGMGGIADGRIAFNRRFKLRNGWVQTQPRPEDLPNVLCPEGPADPEVGVACLRNQDGRITASLLHHSAHPVSHFSTNHVSSSWPGAWCRRFHELADQAVPLMANGCCGNINVYNALDPSRPCDDEHISEYLMQSSGKVFASLNYTAPGVVGARRRRIDIPFGSLPDEVVRLAHDRIRNSRAPEWANEAHTQFNVDWIFSSAVVDLSEKLANGGTYPYEIQVFRIGDLALVGLIGEPFSEGQLEIKRRSPARRTFVAHMCNGYVGYIPTRDAYHARNFNYLLPDGRPVLRGANLFQLIPEALDIIVDTSCEMLDELFA